MRYCLAICITILLAGSGCSEFSPLADKPLAPKVETVPKKDDAAKLNAAKLQWETRRFDAVKDILAAWKSCDLTKNFQAVFDVAHSAASTHDPRVLPLLEMFLGTKSGEADITEGVSAVKWPFSATVVWGAYGQKGFEHLRKNLPKYSQVQKETALLILGGAYYVPALSDIRKIAGSKNEKPAVRNAAIRALGNFGHPQDYDLILASALSNDVEEVFNGIYALYEYGDRRAVKVMITKIADPDPRIRDEAVTGICEQFYNFDGIKLIREESLRAKDAKMAEEYKNALTTIYREINITEEQFWGFPEPQLRKFLQDLPDYKNKYFSELQVQDLVLNRKHLEQLLAEWNDGLSLRTTRYAWAKPAQIINASTRADIPALYELRSKLLSAVTPDSLAEANTIDDIIRYLERAEYRKVPGVTECAEAPDKR